MKRDLYPTLEAIAGDLNAGATQAALGRVHRLLSRLSAGRRGHGHAAWLVIGAVGRQHVTPDAVWRALELHASAWLEAADSEKEAQASRRERCRLRLSGVSIRREVA